MIDLIAVAVAAIRAASAHCPALADRPPVTLIVERDAAGRLGHYDGGLTVYLDPRTPPRMVARVVAHEVGHVCAVLTSGDWSERAARRIERLTRIPLDI